MKIPVVNPLLLSRPTAIARYSLILAITIGAIIYGQKYAPIFYAPTWILFAVTTVVAGVCAALKEYPFIESVCLKIMILNMVAVLLFNIVLLRYMDWVIVVLYVVIQIELLFFLVKRLMTLVYIIDLQKKVNGRGK